MKNDLEGVSVCEWVNVCTFIHVCVWVCVCVRVCVCVCVCTKASGQEGDKESTQADVLQIQTFCQRV